MIDKPIEGFIKGPLEGVEGIYKGTSSLINKATKGNTYIINNKGLSTRSRK